MVAKFVNFRGHLYTRQVNSEEQIANNIRISLFVIRFKLKEAYIATNCILWVSLEHRTEFVYS